MSCSIRSADRIPGLQPDAVVNGIACDEKNPRLLMTGKL